MKVAVRCEKHSPIFGQPASWQTVCSFSSVRSARVRRYSGEEGARTLIQSGCLRSAITDSFRRSQPLAHALEDLPHDLLALRADQRIFADEESRHAADAVAM